MACTAWWQTSMAVPLGCRPIGTTHRSTITFMVSQPRRIVPIVEAAAQKALSQPDGQPHPGHGPVLVSQLPSRCPGAGGASPIGL